MSFSRYTYHTIIWEFYQMRTGDKITFNNKHKLDKMLSMRKEGWSYIALGIFFNVDHSSIYYMCKKYNVIKGPERRFSLYSFMENPYIKRIKTYEEYLKESKKRLSQ